MADALDPLPINFASPPKAGEGRVRGRIRESWITKACVG